VKGVQIKPRREECAEDTEQRSKYTSVTLEDAQIKVRRKEECALGMVLLPNAAVLMDAQIKLKKDECAASMAQTATPRKYLPHTHSIQNLTKLLQL
jgi:hypothetical protein